jgi:hypothetical protein
MTDPRSGESDPDVEDPPGDDQDLDAYPSWWRRNVEEFREYDLPPYRPPRFDDGELLPPVVSALEDDLGASIKLRVVDPQAGNRWEVVVDGEPVAAVDRERHPEGYSVVHVTAEAFETMVRDR